MCLIKFWIINIPTKTVIHEREFPINLAKSKKLNFNGDLNHFKLRDKVNFVNAVFTALAFEGGSSSLDRSTRSSSTMLDSDTLDSSPQAEQLEYYDFATSNKLPVIELNLDENFSIWPLIIIEQNKNLFCGLPLVYNDSKELIDHLSISIGFSILRSIINFYSKENRSNLELFISNYLPFGQLISFPVDLSKNSMLNLVGKKERKQDAIIFLKLVEFISSSSLDKELIYGSLIIENSKSLGDDCRMILNLKDLDQLNLVLSPYCKKVVGGGRDSRAANLQVRLNQPGCKMIHYLCDNKLFRPFIVYDYTVTRSSTQKLQYRIELQINVNVAMNMNFTYFNVIFTSCFVEKTARVLHSQPNWGQLSLEKNGLTWFIGNKLPKSLSLKISLDVVCDRSDSSFADACLSFKADAFNYAFPKLNMDNLQISNSNQKSKLVTELSFATVNYKLVPNLE